ncbi:MAG: DUF928 domain-containing protein [Microcoleus sp.]
MNQMKRFTKFLLNLTSVSSMLLIATLDVSQFAVVGQVSPKIDTIPGTEPGGPRVAPSTPGKPETEPGGPRFVQPTDDAVSGDAQRVTRTAAPCVKGKIDLTALVPENKITRTVSEYPVFFFYLPQTDAPQAEFVLQDENGKQIYQTTLKINNSSGVTGVSIPANGNMSPLQVGKKYRWFVALICDAQDRSADVSETGIVGRVELSADIRSKLEKADVREKTFIYAQNGIWQDALSTLAAARLANPNDAKLTADWASLLDSVKLGKIATEPIVEIAPEPSPPEPSAPIEPQPSAPQPSAPQPRDPMKPQP